MKRIPLSSDLLRALSDANRSRGWNTRPDTVRLFELGACVLYVVPFRRWAYRRIERQAAEWRAQHRAPEGTAA